MSKFYIYYWDDYKNVFSMLFSTDSAGIATALINKYTFLNDDKLFILIRDVDGKKDVIYSSSELKGNCYLTNNDFAYDRELLKGDN